jgi:LysR family glycine cleavage system transcriptional activator
MRRGRLPLTALRSFESAGRLLSFSRAAEELFVTQAAISRQIHDLEASLGTKLFVRHHRRVALTEAGTGLLTRITRSFDEIDAAVEAASGSAKTSELVVGAEPGFAARWLVPSLSRFRAIRPDVDVEVLADAQVVEFRTSRAELAIRYGAERGQWPRVQATCLMQSVVTPVLSPGLLASGPPLTAPEALLAYTLLHDDSRQSWAIWLERAGVASAPLARGPIFNDHALVIQAAIGGQGVALGDIALVRDDVAAGRLIAPFSLQIPFGGYWLVAPNWGRLSPVARVFADWLTAETGQQGHEGKTGGG